MTMGRSQTSTGAGLNLLRRGRSTRLMEFEPWCYALLLKRFAEIVER